MEGQRIRLRLKWAGIYLRHSLSFLWPKGTWWEEDKAAWSEKIKDFEASYVWFEKNHASNLWQTRKFEQWYTVNRGNFDHPSNFGHLLKFSNCHLSFIIRCNWLWMSMFSLIYPLFSEYVLYLHGWNFKKEFDRKVEKRLVLWKKSKFTPFHGVNVDGLVPLISLHVHIH